MYLEKKRPNLSTLTIFIQNFTMLLVFHLQKIIKIFKGHYTYILYIHKNNIFFKIPANTVNTYFFGF